MGRNSREGVDGNNGKGDDMDALTAMRARQILRESGVAVGSVRTVRGNLCVDTVGWCSSAQADAIQDALRPSMPWWQRVGFGRVR